jgi:guanosine-3',5'-bis(diphosphate) 3'-pyrophosphohydrolase
MQHEIGFLLKALNFAADKHRNQRRKDKEASPYINHPIQVADLLSQVGQIQDVITLAGALLHDTLEDTATTSDEIRHLFGEEVLSIVQEVTDDKRLSKVQRKRLQIEHAPYKSTRAKLIKLADKICNVSDIHRSPPSNWSYQRRLEYLAWTEKVVAGLRGVNAALEAYYETVLTAAQQALAHNQEVHTTHFQPEDRVRHPRRPEWGLGKIIECTFDQRLRVFFVNVGMKRLKLENTSLIKLPLHEAQHPLLDHLRPIATGEKVRYRGISELIEVFLGHFEEGFYEDEYIKQYRLPELQVQSYAADLLNHIVYTQLLEIENYVEICQRVLDITARTRLLKSDRHGKLAESLTSPEQQKQFSIQLYHYLFDSEEESVRFEKFVASLAQLGITSWQLTTYFSFIFTPQTAILCTPNVINTAAERCLFDIHYARTPNWKTYQAVQSFVRYLKQEFIDMRPRDMLDIYILLALITNHLPSTSS